MFEFVVYVGDHVVSAFNGNIGRSTFWYGTRERIGVVSPGTSTSRIRTSENSKSNAARKWQRVPNSPNSFSQFTRNVEKIIKVDNHTIQMKTSTPMLPNDLANVYIVSTSSTKGMTTQDFNFGKAATND